MSMFSKQLKNDFTSIEETLEDGLSDILDNNHDNNNSKEEKEEQLSEFIEDDIVSQNDSTDNIETDYEGDNIEEDMLFDLDSLTNESVISTTNGQKQEEEQKQKEDNGNLLDSHWKKEVVNNNISNKENKVVNKDINIIRMEVWDFIKKWDSFTVEEQEEIIGDKNLLNDFTPEEAIKIVEDWEESKRVHIGDIIECGELTGICVGINIPNPKRQGKFFYLVTNGGEHPMYFDTETTIKTEKSINLNI